ncbi:hypothetical protein [Haloferax sp. DFSO52]|uniref:hypothetical protein n=1 Tax=Haloferax sp. DFSO52 TaxID=3388505 RepID=UPI003A83C098
MNRRNFLHSLALGGLVSVTGCLGQLSPTVITPVVESDDFETHLHFGPQNDPIATATFRTHGGVATGQTPLQLTLWHRKQTRVESMSVSVTALSDDSERPRPIALGLDGDVFGPSATFSRMADGTPIVELANLGDAGRDNVNLDLWFSPDDTPPTECAVRVVAEVSGTGVFGGRYTCHGGTVLSLRQ